MGTFKTNPTKPFRTVNSAGELTIHNAKRLARPDELSDPIFSTRTSTANASPIVPQRNVNRTIINVETDHSEVSSQIGADPMLTNGSEAMVSGLRAIGLAGHGDDLSKPPGSTYFPINDNFQANALFAAGGHDGRDEDHDGKKLNLQDWIDFGDDNEHMDNTLPTPMSNSPTAASCDIQPRTSSPKDSSSDTNVFYKHFEEGVTRAFHHVQTHQPPPHLTYNGPALHRHTIKNGRHAPSDSLGSPPRKRKPTGTLSPAANGGSPAKKRSGHRR